MPIFDQHGDKLQPMITSSSNATHTSDSFKSGALDGESSISSRPTLIDNRRDDYGSVGSEPRAGSP